MSSTTNIALNSRSMNGIITISDGQAVLENGDLQCDDINSSSLTTGNITSNIFTCNGELRTNLVGPYVIPTIISSLMGSLISYGNTLNSGATDFTNFQSTYTSTKGGFNFWNKSSTQTLTNLAIIDNSQTYFKNQLIGCTAETPVNPTSIANKTYVDSNFVDLINQQVIAGNKIFNDTVTILNDIVYRDILSTLPVKELQTYLTGNILTYFPLFNLNIYKFITKNSSGTQKNALEITNADMTTNCNFITNNQNTFNNFAPISNTEPSISTHLTTKNYTDTTYVNLTTNQTIGGNKTFNNQNTFNNFAPISNTAPSLAAHLTTKTYTDTTFQTIANMTNYVDIATNNQIITGSKIFNNDQLFKTAALIYDQTALSTKYMKLSQSIDTFTLQSQNGQASQFQISLQNVGGAYNTILSMNSSQATIAGSLSVNSILTSNSSATLKNSNTFGTLTTDEQTINSYLNLKFRTRIYDVFGSANHTQIYMIGGVDFVIYPIPNSGAIQLYAKNSVGGEFNVFSFTALLNTCRVPLTCLQQATFNTVAPLCSIAPSVGDSLCNKTYVDSVIAGAVSLAGLNTWTNTNTFNLDIIVKSSVYLKSISGGKQATFYLDTYGTLAIGSDNVSGKIQLNTQDSLGNTYNRVYITADEINLTVPISVNIDYTYYNPVNFGSNRLGYSTSNTGGTNTLTTSTGNNSGQLNLPAGSWNITYTGTISVITGTLTSLESLHLFIADSLNANLNIIGLEVLNYYQISSIPNGKQIKISASGNIISYNNVNTQYNLRLIPIFVAGAGGLTFTGKISATRNA